MNSGYIAVLDSGVGGISVLNEMIKIMPYERYLYFGDNKNAPYGNRTKTDLALLMFKNIDMIKRYDIKALVIGCNTISTTILSLVSEYANVPTFGVFPPIEKAVCENDKVLLLSTVRTANEYKNVKGLSIIGFDRLAEDIEKNLTDLSRVDLVKNINNPNNVYYGEKNYIEPGVETVILGCTHYSFIKKQIFNHFSPKKIISGNPYTARTVHNFLKSNNLLEKNKRIEVNFIGEFACQNQKFFIKSGQNI